MQLYLVQSGTMEGKRPLLKWRVDKQEFVWAYSSDSAREYGKKQYKNKLIRVEEIYAAIECGPSPGIYTVEKGDRIG